MDVYRVAASVAAAIALTACAAVGARPPTTDSTAPSAITPTIAVTSTTSATSTSPPTTGALASTTTTDAIVPGRPSTTPVLATEVPRAAQPVPPLPADLISKPAALPPDPVTLPPDEPSADDDTRSDELVAIGWVVELATYRADEPIEDRRARLNAYTDTASLTAGPLPFDLGTAAPEAMWPTDAIVSHDAEGVVTVDVWLNTTPTSGTREPVALVRVEVTIAEGRVIGSKVRP